MAPKPKTTPKKLRGAKKNGLTWDNGLGRVETNPKVMLGKPVIRGTRIPVELILRKLGEGASEEDLISGYPRLTHEDILAALSYGAATVAHQEPMPI